MGKSRKSQGGTNSSKEKTYHSRATGNDVPLGDFTEEEMEHFLAKVETWLQGFAKSPDYHLTDEELDYIFSHFDFSEESPEVLDGHLYRIEPSHHFELKNYKVGDTLYGDSALRSFSKEIGATNKMLDQTWAEDNDIVIYRTMGNVPFFNATKYVNPYPYQKEVFVPLDTMKIKGIHTFSGENMPSELYEQYGLELGDSYYSASEVTVVDVAYNPEVKSVIDYRGHSVPIKR